MVPINVLRFMKTKQNMFVYIHVKPTIFFIFVTTLLANVWMQMNIRVIQKPKWWYYWQCFLSTGVENMQVLTKNSNIFSHHCHYHYYHHNHSHATITIATTTNIAYVTTIKPSPTPLSLTTTIFCYYYYYFYQPLLLLSLQLQLQLQLPLPNPHQHH